MVQRLVFIFLFCSTLPRAATAADVWTLRTMVAGPQPNEVRLVFNQGNLRVVAHDFSGSLTLATMVYLLLKPFEVRLCEGKPWESMREEQVRGWTIAKPFLLDSLAHIRRTYELITKNDKILRPNQKGEAATKVELIDTLAEKVEAHKKFSPSVGRVTELFSEFVADQMTSAGNFDVEFFENDKRLRQEKISDASPAPAPLNAILSFPFALSRIKPRPQALTAITADPSVFTKK
jgi:hypothetical protein